jgi:hypothetical protein
MVVPSRIFTRCFPSKLPKVGGFEVFGINFLSGRGGEEGGRGEGEGGGGGEEQVHVNSHSTKT